MIPHDDAIDPSSPPATRHSAAPSLVGPSALASLSQMELQAAFESAATLALALSASAEAAVDVVRAAFDRLKTAGATDAGHASIIDQALAEVTNLLRERDVAGNPGIAGDEAVRAQAEQDLDELAARVAGHSLAPAVLRCRIEGVERAADIALLLGVSADDVYSAHKLLRHHLREMRARADGSRPEGAG